MLRLELDGIETSKLLNQPFDLNKYQRRMMLAAYPTNPRLSRS